MQLYCCDNRYISVNMKNY